MKLAPKNWTEFQHYKDRNPPWIRLHRKLLDDRDFQRLPLASKALAPMLWLLASESKSGVFDGSIEELTFRLRCRQKDIEDGLPALVEKGFFVRVQDDSEVLADGQQVAPESCSETETETETLQRQNASAFVLPDWIPADTWAAYLETRKGKKAKNEPHALGLIVKDLVAFRESGYDAVTILNNSIKGGWAGVFEPKSQTRRAGDVVLTTVPTNPAAIFKPEPQLTPEQLAANRERMRKEMAKLKGTTLQ